MDQEEMVEVLVLVLIWRDWRPNVQIAPINRTGGGGGLQLRKVFVQRRPLWTVVGGISGLRASLCNVTQPYKKLSAEEGRGSPSRPHLADQVRTELRRGFDLLIICIHLDFPVSPLQLLCHLGNIQMSSTLTAGVELSLSLVPSLSVHSSARLLTWLFYDSFFSPSSDLVCYATL